MSPRNIIGVTLVALGVVVLSYSGVTYTTRGKPVDVLGVHIETTKSHFIPPIAGAIALGGGIGLLVFRARKA